MSQQDNPQDSQENAAAPEAESWSTPPASNRPAEGATRVASLQHADQAWNAGANATDFLGLEQDGAPGPAQPTDGAGATEVNPTQAWLFHMENEARAGARAAAAPAAGATGEWNDDPLNSGPAAATAAPQIGDEEFAPQDPELAQDADGAEPALATQFSSADAQPQRKKQWLVAAGLAATLLAAGGWQIWHAKSKTSTTSTGDPIAWRSTSKNPTKPAPGPKAKKPAVEDPAVAVKPPVEQPTGSKPVETPTAPTTAQATPPVEPQPVAPDPQPSATTTTPPSDPPLAQADPAPTPDFTPVAFPGMRPNDPSSPLVTPRGTRRPDPAEIAGLWTSQAIPFDAIGAESMLRTPAVGAVRVLLKNGEHFQGLLYSVGQGRVRMDVALGRMSVDYSDVSEIVQILEADLTKKPSNGLPEETAGLLRVSAKVPGGYLNGWLVQRADGKLTLITEQAKKITVEDDGFEPVPKGGARVVGTLARDATEALSPAPAPDTSTPKLQTGTPGSKTPAKTPARPSAAKPKPKPGGAKPKG